MSTDRISRWAISTPDKVYRTASGGGAGIVDKYKKLNKLKEELKVKEGQRLSAA